MDPTTVLILLLSFVAGALSVWLLLRLRPGRETPSAPGDEPLPSPASPPDTQAHIPVLQALARGAPFAEVMRQICLLAEQALPDAICVTAVLDPSSHRLNMYASRLSQDLLDVLAAVDGDAGAGTAVAAIVRGETVICEDIATDPVWSRCRALPLEQNLRSSVSVPIVGTDEAVVGSVTAFHATPLRPSAAAACDGSGCRRRACA